MKKFLKFGIITVLLCCGIFAYGIYSNKNLEIGVATDYNVEKSIDTANHEVLNTEKDENGTENGAKTNTENQKVILNNVISMTDSLYDFSNYDVLSEQSDLIVIGKIKSIDKVSNYVESLNTYAATRTYATVEIIDVVSDNTIDNVSITENVNVQPLTANNLEVGFYGGTIPYIEYEKSLFPAEIEKNNALMAKEGSAYSRENTLVKTFRKDQLEIDESETYLLFLVYNEYLETYVPVSSVHGVKAIDVSTKNVMNHVTGKTEMLNEIINK